MEAKIYNPHERKLNSRSLSEYFIGYPIKSKTYRFYTPKHDSRIVKTNNARFLKNVEVTESVLKEVVDIGRLNSKKKYNPQQKKSIKPS